MRKVIASLRVFGGVCICCIMGPVSLTPDFIHIPLGCWRPVMLWSSVFVGRAGSGVCVCVWWMWLLFPCLGWCPPWFYPNFPHPPCRDVGTALYGYYTSSTGSTMSRQRSAHRLHRAVSSSTEETGSGRSLLRTVSLGAMGTPLRRNSSATSEVFKGAEGEEVRC